MTSRTASLLGLATGVLTLLPLSACAPSDGLPEETDGTDAVIAPSPDVPPEAGSTQEISPPSGQVPASYRNIRTPQDIPPPSPPAPVFTPEPRVQGDHPGETMVGGRGLAQREEAGAKDAAGMREIFPSVRIDPAARVVEFDGAIAWDVHDPQTPMTYLELVVCTPDTKEHESLVVTRARPSNVHAALLLLGLEPGKPGTYTWENERVRPVDPQGPPVDVAFVLNAGTPHETVVNPLTWIVNAADGTPFARGAPPGRSGWLFAGSRIVRRDVGQGEQDFYLADGDDGSLIGLTTFGAETIAWHRTISPDSSIDEPEWIANVAAMPRIGTPVVVRLTPAAPPQPPHSSHPPQPQAAEATPPAAAR